MKTLEITSYVPCPNNCSYCAQSKLKNAYKGNPQMNLFDFSQILLNVPKDVRIDFSGFSEIFCHDQGALFIRSVYDLGYRVVLYTTLVGFQSTDATILRGVKFDDLCFHQYPGVDLKWFEKKKETFENIIQSGRTAEITKQWLWSRAGNVFDTKKRFGQYECLFAKREFNHNVVLPNGDVYICCQDYSLRHRIGNLYETNFNALDRRDLVESSNQLDSDTICRYCEIMQKT